ncbi:MAG: hypothetical protein JWQ98_834 [Chlorobi bacterium]|nr:hypothetical protein [Chlorobiota bacterium]
MKLRIITLIIASAILAGCAGTSTTRAATAHRTTDSTGTHQVIDSLKLAEKDLMAGYTFSEKSHIRSFQANTYYESPGTFSRITGLIEQKASQSIDGPDGDNGTVLFLRFRGPFKGDGFIQGLIWGNGDGPTAENPEEILIKDDMLVIISFKKGSAMGGNIKEIMKRKMGI